MMAGTVAAYPVPQAAPESGRKREMRNFAAPHLRILFNGPCRICECGGGKGK